MGYLKIHVCKFLNECIHKVNLKGKQERKNNIIEQVLLVKKDQEVIPAGRREQQDSNWKEPL